MDYLARIFQLDLTSTRRAKNGVDHTQLTVSFGTRISCDQFLQLITSVPWVKNVTIAIHTRSYCFTQFGTSKNPDKKVTESKYFVHLPTAHYAEKSRIAAGASI